MDRQHCLAVYFYLGAFSFNNFIIGDPLEITSFFSEESPARALILKWDLVKNATSFVLERKIEMDFLYLKNLGTLQ